MAIVPFAGSVVLAQVGAILSVMFRSTPPADGAASQAALYAFGMLPMPLLLSFLLVGYRRARIALLVLLYGCLALTVTGLGELLEIKRKAALGLLPFILAQGCALLLGHGARLRNAVASIEARRNERWGSGFGWMLVISGAGLFSSGAVTVLGAVELARAGGPDLLHLPGVLRLVPVAVGLGAATFGLSRIVRSRAPMAWISAVGLLLLTLVIGRNGLANAAGRFASFAMGLDIFVLVALSQPTFKAFCERHRKDS